MYTFLRYILITAAIFTALLHLTGCGSGSTSHSITSPYPGRLAGIATLPQNDELNIATDTWIKIYWPDSRYPPPPSFTFGLQKQESYNNWTPRSTRLKSEFSDPINGVWWFEPISLLDICSNYRFWVKDDRGFELYFYFSTTCNLGFRTQSDIRTPIKHRPAGAENIQSDGSEGKNYHKIYTRISQ